MQQKILNNFIDTIFYIKFAQIDTGKYDQDVAKKRIPAIQI